MEIRFSSISFTFLRFNEFFFAASPILYFKYDQLRVQKFV